MTEAVNHQLPDWHAYVRDRQQRRQDRVDALTRATRDAAPDPGVREIAGQAARRAGEAAFDVDEPELSYEDWKAGL